MGQILPILKRSVYRENDRLFFKKRLFESTAAPVIAYGTDEGVKVIYESASDEADYQNRIQSLRNQALDNLKNIRPQVDVQDTGDGKQVSGLYPLLKQTRVQKS
ncbi:MAG: hypothetical protein ABWZ25_18020 [Chitinophagaceae bacterium]